MAGVQSKYGQHLGATPVKKHALEERLLVAAIDFGTTYSGYAFQSKGDFILNPLKIHINQWENGGQGQSYKTPSCILFDPRENFHSFGIDAINKYNDLVLDEREAAGEWYFFKQFKMLLYNEQELGRKTLLYDATNKPMLAMKVFTHAIKFLKDHFLTTVTDAGNVVHVKENEMHWVLTVPAIWSDNAKRFMRESAINAEINTDRLSLSLEPEAASLLCRYLPVERVEIDGQAKIQCIGVGDEYMIIDAGGGTVDMTIHRVLDNDTLQELDKANGGDWGGVKVDENYLAFLKDVFGQDAMEVVEKFHPDDFLSLMDNFEIKKQAIEPNGSRQVTFSIPVSLSQAYKDFNNIDFIDETKLSENLQGKIQFKQDKLKVDSDVVEGFFDEVCEMIGVIAKGFYDQQGDTKVSKILMVGGFCQSKMLQKKIRALFPKLKMIIPEDASMAVVKGAVLFGFNPAMITSRVCKKTYGIKAYKQWESALDPPDKKVRYDDNVWLCKDAFSKHAEIGQRFKTNETVSTQEYVPSDFGVSELNVEVYTSTQKHPRYIDEQDCKKVGDIKVPLQKTEGEDRSVFVEFSFGLEELQVHIVESMTNNRTEAQFELL
ncbi:hypothetical protein ACF0H5_010661 [Mactra antiquata]